MVQCPESVIGQEVVDLHVKVVELHIEVQVTVNLRVDLTHKIYINII
jgi:hypothetical protein